MPKSAAPWEVKHRLVVKSEDKTNPKYGRIPKERPAEELMHYGVINLDKQAGPSSHEVAAWVKRILKVQAVGHGGTLEARY
jgi:tRNA U55 pseudouridine synthase TruB